jgi:hypothetical protein
MDALQQIMQQKAAALASIRTDTLAGFNAHQAPADSHPFVYNSSAAFAYPAPGAGPATMLAYTVPPGSIAVINMLSIVAIGGAFIDASGQLIWRCWLNGSGIDGLENLQAQIGSLATPVPIQVVLTENDLFLVTVEIPAGQPGMPPLSTSVARIWGWTYSLTKVSRL